MRAERRVDPRTWLARLLWAHHLLLVIFIAVAWALPWAWALWMALAFYPVVLLSWRVFDNRCVLTVLEEKLRRTAEVVPAGEPLHFAQAFANHVLGLQVSRSTADFVSYATVCGGFALTGLRLYFRS